MYNQYEIRAAAAEFGTISESWKRTRRSSATLTIFLSHSHHDRDLIEAAAKFLMKQNAYVYVDWLDEAMPTSTSPLTAKRIKEKIREMDKFVVLLTEKSADSKWVPWELGFADPVKGIPNIAIFPILRSNASSLRGIEYMGLYPRIESSVFNNITKPAIWAPKVSKPTYRASLGDSWMTTKKSNYEGWSY